MDNDRSLHWPIQPIDFEKCFKKLTGNQPFRWQQEFFNRLLSGVVPKQCDVPTGLGKTSVIAVWLLALAQSLMIRQIPRKIPLRLVYVVDRRVIVDQSTDEARQAINALEKAESKNTPEGDNPLTAVAQVLRETAFVKDGPLVVLSALRGQMAESREWCFDPSRPAVIIGTVDMIGSRTLFSGYGGLGRSHRSLQAGLLGQDTLLLIDEAHLSPTFVATVKEIHNEIHRFRNISPFHVMSLSATIPSVSIETCPDSDQPSLFDEQQELANPVAKDRLNARKHIEWLHFDQPKSDKKKPSHKDIEARKAEVIVELANRYEGQSLSIIIFVATVGLVNEVGEMLSNGLGKGSADRILKMTGEMRGFERDSLVKSEKFRMFLPQRNRSASHPTHYLIATSCAEVGVNLDGDHGICDLTSLDSMIQRIGRINRFGKTDSSITVVVDKNALSATSSDILREIDGKRKLNHINRRITRIEGQLNQGEEARTGSTSKGGKTSSKDDVKEIKAELKAAQKTRKEIERAGIEYDENIQNVKRMDRTHFYTWRVLKRTADDSGRVDSSPLALRALSHDLRAWPRPPVRPAVDPARLDDWSMTSLQQSEFPRPLVAYWLRGVIADETAQTVFCWRADLDHAISSEQATGMAEMIPIAPQERAVLSTYRAESLIKELAKHSPDQFVVIMNSRDDYQALTLQDLGSSKDALFATLAYATVIIPCMAGGLSKDGNVLEKLSGGPVAVCDVVNRVDWARYILRRLGDGSYERARLADYGDLAEQMIHSSLKEALFECADACGGICINVKELKKFFVDVQDESEDEEEHRSASQIQVAYFLNRKSSEHYLREADDFTSVGMEGGRSVAEHNADVECYVKEIARKIGLDDELIGALGLAGLIHDRGKDREWWQAAIGNPRTEGPDWKPLAKSIHKGFNHSLNQHYRHELGSLIEAEAHDELKNHPCRELIMHLIAAHHGYARPHFPENAFDGKQPSAVNRKIVQETMRRFASLQRKYGWWQLAYLEAILKAADALASRDFSRGTL